MTDNEAPRVLLTERLDLRAISVADTADLHRVTSNPLNCEYVPGGLHDSIGVTRAWVDRRRARWAQDGLGYWTVRLRSSREVVGVAGAERRQGFWNLLYRLDRAHWGHGYATEVARAAQAEAGVAAPDLPFVAWIHEENAPSQGVARHLGLMDYGLLEPEHWKGEPMHYWADRQPARAFSAG